MGLSTYSELKESIIRWSKRGDILSMVDDFIDIAESIMYSNPDAQLRIRDMEARAFDNTTSLDRFMPLPENYVQMRQFKLNLDEGHERIIDYVSPDSMIIKQGEGIPIYYTISSQIEFDRVADDMYEVEFLYYQSLAPLSSANPTNAILDRFPQIYLYGALFACKDWAMQPEESAKYYQQFISAIRGANAQDRRGRYHGMSARVHGATP